MKYPQNNAKKDITLAIVSEYLVYFAFSKFYTLSFSVSFNSIIDTALLLFFLFSILWVCFYGDNNRELWLICSSSY